MYKGLIRHAVGFIALAAGPKQSELCQTLNSCYGTQPRAAINLILVLLVEGYKLYLQLLALSAATCYNLGIWSHIIGNGSRRILWDSQGVSRVLKVSRLAQ